MVLKIKHSRDIARRNAPSQQAKKKMKEEYKSIKKFNYKTKKETNNVECSICFSMVKNSSDNSIMCGKTTHFICGECKFRCNETGNTKCPMCRSHDIKNPIARDVKLNVIEIGHREKKTKIKYCDMRMKPKERRNFCRKNSGYNMPFTSRTNRIVRQRTGYTSRYLDSGNGFISNARAMHYNGNLFQTQQVLDGYDSDDTISTLELVDVESEDEYLYELAAELERIIVNNE
tara:strand:+ start:115 stop:807 length:693 start_codon:yes stop_codon:yes gene_type:complete